MSATPPAVVDHSALLSAASQLDASDALSSFVDEFEVAPGVSAYLDGNSLGRPVRGTAERVAAFIREDWGTRLIRSWDEGWMELPFALGDRIARATLGAAAGQTVVADSTTVLLYKLLSAAVADAPPGGRIVIERGNFPSDRFVVEGIAGARDLTVEWIDPDPITGMTVADAATALSGTPAVLVLNHVDYRSGALADMEAITTVARDAGSVIIWDLCHSAGVIPLQLDAWGVDLAVGCTYKYLNGGPGSPAFAYVSARVQNSLEQPIQGWMGAADVFAMGPHYEAAAGMRRFLSGTPPVTAMLPMQGMLDLIERAGIDAIRGKSRTLTDLAVHAYDHVLAPRGVDLLSPRESTARGSHVMFGHPSFRRVTERLWREGIVPDFRGPSGIRVGLSPLSTTHAEVVRGILAIAAAMPD